MATTGDQSGVRPELMQVGPDSVKVLTPESRQALQELRRHRRLSGSLSSRAYNLTISHARRFVWYRNAKVGTRSLLGYFEDSEIDPAMMVLSHAVYPVAAFDGYFKFGFVRHPLERFLSAWRDKVVRSNHFRFGPEERERMGRPEAFADWVAGQDVDDLRVTDRHVVAQSRLLDLGHLDFLGRMETFDRDFAEVCERIGTPARVVERRNATEAPDPDAEPVPSGLRSVVEQVYRRDYQIFGY